MALNNVQWDYLARDDPQLNPYFYRTVACDRLPKTSDKKTPRGYIVNTDPHINSVNIGWRFGPLGTCVKSWIVTPYPWRDTSKLPR